MNGIVPAVWAGMRAEALHLRRARLLVALAIVQAVTFLLLVSLFGLTGSRAPTALVDEDNGVYAQRFVADLQAAHHSFALRRMSRASAMKLLRQGDLVAMITVPPTFSRAIAHGQTVALPIAIDNVDADLTDDIQRALPSAIVAFAQQSHLPGIHLHPAELDLIGHDTGFSPISSSALWRSTLWWLPASLRR